jgi:diadenosine tetraphosphate (Ap4A) HIT family hydrolase
MAWTDGMWLVRHHAHPAPLAGWFLLDSVRCVRNPAHFSDGEAGAFGDVLRLVTRVVGEACGVPRTYTVMFGEGAPHLHAHIIPRDPAESASCAWSVADLYRDVELGRRAPASHEQVDAVVARVRSLLVSGAR